MTTPEILRRAAQEIRDGWIKYSRHDHAGNVCAIGALENARVGTRIKARAWRVNQRCEGHQETVSAAEALASLLPPHRAGPYHAIAEWNNGDKQTAENVAVTMELAAICFEQAHAIEETLVAVDPQVEVLESVTRA